MNVNEVTGYEDPEGEAPWAMQFVVRVEKANPPLHYPALTAVARTCVLALHAFENGDEQAQAALARWRAGRIRKVVRRARGAAWERTDLPGAHTETFDGVQVRAFVPGPVDQVPAELAKLQVGGLNLADDAAPGLGSIYGVRLYLNPDLPLSTGKAAAQVAHAAQLVYEATGSAPRRQAWLEDRACLQVETATAQRWAELADDGDVFITDAGFTEIPAGSMTVIAVHGL